MTRVFVWICAGVLLTQPAVAAQPNEPPAQHEVATFAMYCYWTGEATVGRVPGVVASRIGHLAGEEIVQVDYDPRVTSVQELADALRRQNSLDHVVTRDSDDARQTSELLGGDFEVAIRNGDPHFIEAKHSLRTRYPRIWALDLSEQQRIALNSWSYFGGEMPDVLSDEQRQRLSR